MHHTPMAACTRLRSSWLPANALSISLGCGVDDGMLTKSGTTDAAGTVGAAGAVAAAGTLTWLLSAVKAMYPGIWVVWMVFVCG